VKTLAIRLEDDLHAQMSVLAQLRESTITEEIRHAIENHLESSKHDTELNGRAKTVLEDIERESKARQAAIATLFSTEDQSASVSRTAVPNAVVPLKPVNDKKPGASTSSPGRKSS
jgi:predicted transcriptional regulator